MSLKKEIQALPCGEKDLRNFGLVVGGIFAALGLLFLWKGKAHALYFLGPGALLILLGVLGPRMLKRVYLAWMVLGLLMGEVVSRILLTLLYLSTFTPIGRIGRIFGKRFLDTDFRRPVTSYWNPKPAKPDVKRCAENQF